MDLFLVLGLVNVLGCLVWGGSAVVLSLILLTVARRADDEAVLRAAAETVLLDRRILRPAMLATTLSMEALAWAGGLEGEAWVVLTAILAAAAWVLGRAAVAPACERALQMPRGAAPIQARRALGLAGMSAGIQLVALTVLVLTPGWSEAAILAGLLSCMALAVALVLAPGGHERPA